MFFGWFALIALSFLAYRRAAAVNRRRLLWALLVWPFAFGIGFAVVLSVVVFYLVRGDVFVSEKDATEALMLPSVVGTLGGAAVCVWLAGRSANQSNKE
jgi:hypothetical protein